jgi:hypothetical protein
MRMHNLIVPNEELPDENLIYTMARQLYFQSLAVLGQVAAGRHTFKGRGPD